MRLFPAAGKDEIREFLRIVVDAFPLPRRHMLKFRPDDMVMEIYRAVNPPNWTLGASRYC